MTHNQWRQHTAAAGAVVMAAAAITCAWHGLQAYAVLAGVVVLSLTDTALRAHRAHQRVLAECVWARRRALGENPAPLWPCCLLATASCGRAHHRCTAPYREGRHG